jgi:uncharacterized membrane protein
MNKVLVAVFDTEQAAFEGVSALKELHRDGEITLYASSVIVKDSKGVASIRKSADSGPIGTITGVVAGGLVGLLGGPIGVAVGAYVGGFGGLMFDLFNAGVGIDFVNDVSASLTPGKAAVVADIDETWVTPVETRLGALGATTFRRRSGDVVDDELTREAQDASSELDQLRAELRESMGDAKATVEAKIASQRQKLEALGARVDKALEQQQAEFDQKSATLQAQYKEAQESQKQRIQGRKEELKASHEARQAKLRRARGLTKQSLELTAEALKP